MLGSDEVVLQLYADYEGILLVTASDFIRTSPGQNLTPKPLNPTLNPNLTFSEPLTTQDVDLDPQQDTRTTECASCKQKERQFTVVGLRAFRV